MKKVCISLALAMLITGCTSTGSNLPQKSVATATNVMAVGNSKNLINDPQFTKFRMSNGGQGAWTKEVLKKKNYGNISSSKDSAFDTEGSVRIRFKSKDANFSAQPGVSQTVKDLDTNTNYEFSLYFSDKRRENSPVELVIEVAQLDGDIIARKTVHIDQLKEARRGQLKSHFRQTFIMFNSGKNTKLKLSAKLKVSDASEIDLNGDIGKQTEIRLDEFILMKD